MQQYNDKCEIFFQIFEISTYRKPTNQEVVDFTTLIHNDGLLMALTHLLKNRNITTNFKKNIGFPPGHFYSPIVDIDHIDNHINSLDYNEDKVFSHLNVSLEDMDFFWKNMESYFYSAPWHENQHTDFRYHYRNDAFPFTDALVFSAILQIYKPNKLVEIGSGFSSAVLLDTIDILSDFHLDATFIQPYPHTLKRILKENDWSRFTLIKEHVQSVDLDIYSQLGAGDILFIDSTHVAKTGSDVVFEITNILPKLKTGVLVHFHDIFYPFEYPACWIKNLARSWNEIYFLKAFLIDNPNYHMIMFNNYYTRFRLKNNAFKYERFIENPGGSLWLERV